MHVSYSELRLYKQCPKAYQYRYMARLPEDPGRGLRSFVGSVVGGLVEQFYKQKLWRLLDAAADTLEALVPSVVQAVQAKHPVTFEHADDEALAHLRIVTTIPTLLETIRREKLIGEINLTEHELEIPIDDDVVHGRPDLVMLRKGILTGLDGKFGHSSHVHTDQLKVYALGLAYDPLFKRRPDRIGFWYFRKGEIAWKTRGFTEASGRTLLTELRGLVDGIKSHQFEPTPGKGCGLCDYRSRCVEGQAYLAAHRRETAVPLEANEGTVSL